MWCLPKDIFSRIFFSDSFTKFCTFNILDFWGKDGDLKLNKFSAIFKFWDPFSETFSLSCLNYNSETLDWLFFLLLLKYRILEHKRNVLKNVKHVILLLSFEKIHRGGQIGQKLELRTSFHKKAKGALFWSLVSESLKPIWLSMRLYTEILLKYLCIKQNQG